MAGGDASSSPMAAVAREKEADEPLWKKLKLAEEEEEEEEEEMGVNPLDPRFSDYDPKQRKYVYTRFFYRSNLDLDQESPVGPMRYTDKEFREGFLLANSSNVVSIKIVSSDYGYPLNVYGTIIARDSLDDKCIYLFQRGMDNCQIISSKDDSLILTGPKRGFMVCDAIFFEIDLKVKDVHGRKVKDERLSKGLIEVDGILRLSYSSICELETETLVSMHSILDLSYTFVRNAVEGTVEIRMLDESVDHFCGKIIAGTTSIPCEIVLHDSRVNGVLAAGENGVMETALRVVSVSVDEMLLLTVFAAAAAEGGDEFSAGTVVQFTPRHNGYEQKKIMYRDYEMQVKVTWAIMYF